jgi:hypothetical protein
VSRFVRVLAPLILVLGLVAAPAAASEGPTGDTLVENMPPGVGGFVSENVSYMGTIPLDSPGVGGRVVKVKNQVRFYVTGMKGLTIYDVTDPALPTVIGTFPLPHSQNEDVDVSKDGDRVVISADGALLVPIMPATRGIHIIDTSDPTLPMLAGSISESNHTSTCADAACKWIYGSSGNIYDARNPAEIKNVGRWRADGGGHDLNRDSTGLLFSDSTPRYVLDPRKNPAKPKVIAMGQPNPKVDANYQHNSIRPRASDWKPRKKGTPGYNSSKLRAGEMLIANTETNIKPTCGDAGGGGISTWSLVNFDKGKNLKQLHAFRPMNGDYASDGNPAINALGCSGHWFTEHKNYITAGWYEHGIRFLKVDPTNGKLREVGYFQPVATEASASYWIPAKDGTMYAYTVDYARGIDILKFDPKGATPSKDEIAASWFANLDRVGELSARERYLCQIAAN